MSDTPPPPPPYEYRPPPPEPRSGCLTAIMIVVGCILLLPGLCALMYGWLAVMQRHFGVDYVLSVLFGLLVGALGIVLIRAAARGPGS